MASVKDDARFEEFLSANNMTLDEYEVANDDIKAWVATELDSWKESNPKEAAPEKKNLTPEQQAALDAVYGENFTDKTWDDLDAQQKAYLTDEGLAPKVEEAQKPKETQLETEQTEAPSEEVPAVEGEAIEAPAYTLEEAIALADNPKGLETLMPAELVALNSVLETAATKDEGANKSFGNVQKAIGTKIDYYASGDIDIDIDYAEDMQAMIDSQMRSDKEKTNVNRAKAQERLSTFTKEYDDAHGLTGLTPEDAKRIDDNISSMEDMGQNPFETIPYEEKATEGLSVDDADKVLADLRDGKEVDLKTLASLIATPQAYGSTGPNADLIENAIVGKVGEINKSKELDREDLPSVATILNKAQHLPETKLAAKDYQKANSTLEAGRAEAKSNPELKNESFRDAYNVLNAMEITGGLKMFGREKPEQKDADGNFAPDSDIALFMESVKEQTRQQLATSKEPIDDAKFNEALAENMQLAVVELYQADRVAKGKTSKGDVKETFAKLAEMGQKGKKISISQDSITGYLATKDKESKSFTKRLEGKIGKIPGIAKLNEKIKAIDAKSEAKYGEKYGQTKKFLQNMGKVAFKAAAWGAAFGVATTIGAPAVAAVAVASVANQVLNMRKDFKKQKEEAKAKGQKLKLGAYLKNNKMRLAGMALSSLGAVVPGMQALGGDSLSQAATAMAPYVSTFRAATGIGMGLGSVGKQVSVALKNPSKENWMGVASAAGGFVVGMATGRLAGEMAGDFINNAGDNVQTPVNPAWDKDGNGVPDSIQRPENPAHDLDGNGVPDSIQRPENPAHDLDGNGVPDSIQRPADQMESPTPTQTPPTHEQTAPTPTAPAPEQAAPEVAPVETRQAPEPLEAKPIGLNVESNREVLIEQAKEDMMDLKTHTIIDSQGQTVQYSTDENGLHLVNADKITGHETINEDIAKDVAQRAASGNASQNDINAMQNRTSEENIAQMQSSYDNNKMADTLGEKWQEVEVHEGVQAPVHGVDKEPTVYQAPEPKPLEGQVDENVKGVEKEPTQAPEPVAKEATGMEKAAQELADKVKSGEISQEKADEIMKKSFGIEEKAPEVKAEEPKAQEPKVEEKAPERTAEDRARDTAEARARTQASLGGMKGEAADKYVESKMANYDATRAVINEQAGAQQETPPETKAPEVKVEEKAPEAKAEEPKAQEIVPEVNAPAARQIESENFKGSYTLTEKDGVIKTSIEGNVTGVTDPALRPLTPGNAIYSSMEDRLQAGEELSSAEKSFMKQHEQRLEKSGYERDEDGNMKRTESENNNKPHETKTEEKANSSEDKPKRSFLDKLRGTNKEETHSTRSPSDTKANDKAYTGHSKGGRD